MKRVLLCLISVMLTVVMVFGFAACDLFASCGSDKVYTIQYTYDGDTYRLDVKKGQPYVFDTVPERAGYEFLGLFDKETGGTRYVNESGASVGTFSGKQGMVLYPQFKAREYALILDYQGGEVSGSRQLTAKYDSPLPALPKDVKLAHNVFLGWYTQENCGGIKVADKNGLVPLVSVVNYDNFNLDTGIINLYAGFEAELLTVNLNFGTGTKSESIKVAYDTPVENLIYSTRVDGQGVLSWSKSEGGTVFNGNVTSDTDLYALSFAPVIELDGNGTELAPYVALAGSTIAIPEPQKPYSDFLYWETESGKTFTTKIMPEKGFKLKAIWQPKLVFDVNGGSEVTDIAAAVDETIKLPVPAKEGYIFAGWYTRGKERFTSTKMPSEGMALKAGWYKALTASKTILDSSAFTCPDSKEDLRNKLTINLSDLLPDDFNGQISVQGSISIKHKRASLTDVANVGIGFYKDKTKSDSNRLARYYYKVTSSTYEKFDFSFSASLTGNHIYVSAGSDGWGGNLLLGTSNTYADLANFVCDILYPDTATLYL